MIAKLTVFKSKIKSEELRSEHDKQDLIVSSCSAATSNFILVHPEAPFGTKREYNPRNTYDTDFSLETGSMKGSND